MEPSDIDGREGSETPGEMLQRLIYNAPSVRVQDFKGTIIYMGDEGTVSADDIAEQFKAAILAGQV